MTLRVGNERRNEFRNAYFPIERDDGTAVGTAYDRETAALFAAAPELLHELERVYRVLFTKAEDSIISGEILAAIQKAKGGKS